MRRILLLLLHCLLPNTVTLLLPLLQRTRSLASGRGLPFPPLGSSTLLSAERPAGCVGLRDQLLPAELGARRPRCGRRQTAPRSASARRSRQQRTNQHHASTAQPLLGCAAGGGGILPRGRRRRRLAGEPQPCAARTCRRALPARWSPASSPVRYAIQGLRSLTALNPGPLPHSHCCCCRSCWAAARPTWTWACWRSTPRCAATATTRCAPACCSSTPTPPTTSWAPRCLVTWSPLASCVPSRGRRPCRPRPPPCPAHSLEVAAAAGWTLLPPLATPCPWQMRASCCCPPPRPFPWSSSSWGAWRCRRHRRAALQPHGDDDDGGGGCVRCAVSPGSQHLYSR